MTDWYGSNGVLRMQTINVELWEKWHHSTPQFGRRVELKLCTHAHALQMVSERPTVNPITKAHAKLPSPEHEAVKVKITKALHRSFLVLSR
jgi:hypothetical protein